MTEHWGDVRSFAYQRVALRLHCRLLLIATHFVEISAHATASSLVARLFSAVDESGVGARTIFSQLVCVITRLALVPCVHVLAYSEWREKMCVVFAFNILFYCVNVKWRQFSFGWNTHLSDNNCTKQFCFGVFCVQRVLPSDEFIAESRVERRKSHFFAPIRTRPKRAHSRGAKDCAQFAKRLARFKQVIRVVNATVEWRASSFSRSRRGPRRGENSFSCSIIKISRRGVFRTHRENVSRGDFFFLHEETLKKFSLALSVDPEPWNQMD